MNDQDQTKGKNRRFDRRRITQRLLMLPLVAFGGLFLLSWTATRPENLGVQNGRLAPCPDSPNCVSSQATNPDQKMAAIPLQVTAAEMIEKIKRVIGEDFSRATLVREMDNYLHFEFRSTIFRFVDDVEFLVDDSSGTVDFRSASRVGHSDLGANRNRMEKILARLKK